MSTPSSWPSRCGRRWGSRRCRDESPTRKESVIEVLVGRIGRAHGLRGDVTLDVRTDEPERRFAPDTVFVTPRGTLTVKHTTWHGGRLLASFVEVTDRTGAEGLRGIELRAEVTPDERPDDPEEFYDHQLVGLTAVDGAGAPIGPVTDVLHLPAQDMLVLDRDGREVLVPFVADLVPAVDLAARTLVVVAQPGLLDELPEDELPADSAEEDAAEGDDADGGDD